MHDPRFDELVALAAIEALDPVERRDLDRHVAEGCPTCTRELASFRRVVSELVFAGPAATPPLRLRERLPVPIRGRTSWAGGLALAASVLLAVAVGDDVWQRIRADHYRLQAEGAADRLASARTDLARRDLRARFFENPDVQSMTLGGLGPQAHSRGKIYFSPRARRAILLAVDLAPLPSGRQYELWMIAGGIPVPAGTFDIGTPSTVFESAALPQSAAGEKFAVTVEPRGGVPTPTGPMVLLGPA